MVARIAGVVGEAVGIQTRTSDGERGENGKECWDHTATCHISTGTATTVSADW